MRPHTIDCIDHDSLPSGGRLRRALRLIGWNTLLTVAIVAGVALAGEAYFRLTMSSMSFPLPTWKPMEFVPNVGYVRTPNTEIRHTNRLDFWNVSRTNSLGFLDREPPSPERAAATCHVSIIGDSFVEALQVPIHRKLQVRLEELAASRLPHLDVTTSAFGLSGTGQVQQLPFYDEYARRLHPKLLVLVFVYNDFINNSPFLRRWSEGIPKPGGPIVRRRPDGKLELAWSLPPRSPSVAPTPRVVRAARKATHYSWFARWLQAKKNALFPRADRDLPPFYGDALQYTRFALEQFQQRADRDGAKLVILASHTMKSHGTLMFERMGEIAATLDIPVIDQADYILRQDADLSDAQWPHDYHWSPAGHQWTAEALLEYIEQHPDVCDG